MRKHYYTDVFSPCRRLWMLYGPLSSHLSSLSLSDFHAATRSYKNIASKLGKGRHGCMYTNPLSVTQSTLIYTKLRLKKRPMACSVSIIIRRVVFRVGPARGRSIFTRFAFTARSRTRCLEPRSSRCRWRSSSCRRSSAARRRTTSLNSSTRTARTTSYRAGLPVGWFMKASQYMQCLRVK